jgi:signal transduction histidine kinase
MIDDRPVARTLRSLVVWSALAGALVATIIVGIVVGIAVARMQHATLDAASVALRESVADTDAPRTAARLASLRGSLETWGLVAAAFDLNGKYFAGDHRLRANGLPAGRAPAAPSARQVAVLDTRDGYVLLSTDPNVVDRLRASVIVGCALTFTIVFGGAYAIGDRWGRARGRSAAYMTATLAAQPLTASPVVVNDPVFGRLSGDIAAAVERLARTVAERTEGEERLRSFLAEAAHELRTPLAIAIGYLGILERGALSDSALATRIVRDVGSEHARLQRLVDRILQLARLDAIPADRSTVTDVRRVVDESVALVRPLDTERVIAVEASGTPWAAIASDELRDAVRNLLENSIRYAPGARIAVTITEDTLGVTVRVSDDGPGMDGFTAEHAFDRFFRGADRGDIPGSGLGLAIVKRVAERAEGTVTIASRFGSGTTVELRLPRAVATA